MKDAGTDRTHLSLTSDPGFLRIVVASRGQKAKGSTGDSGDTICEPSLLDDVARANILPYKADNASFDRPPRKDDEAGEKGMTVQHHF
jgi:hypothetical protein